MSEAMWEDERLRSRSASTASATGAMARRPSIVPSAGAGPLPAKPLPVEQPYTVPEGWGPASEDFADLDTTEVMNELEGGESGVSASTPESGGGIAGDPAAGRAGLWAQGAPPSYGAQEDLPPAYSEQDPHPQRLPWWKRAKRSFGRGLRKVAGFLGLGSLIGGRR